MTATTTAHANAHLPALSAAHQRQLGQLVSSLAADGALPDDDLALLRGLSDALPALRAGLPKAAQQTLAEIDATETMLSEALENVRAASATFGAAYGATLPARSILQPQELCALSQQLETLAHCAAEAALRAQQRAALLEGVGTA